MSTAGGWPAQQLWQLFPFLLIAAFAALGAAAGGGLYLLLARKMSVRRSVAIAAAAGLGSVVLIALVFAWSSGVMVPAPGTKPFEAQAWQAKPWVRWGMAQNLVESDRLLGMKKEDVILLLGGPTGSFSPLDVDLSESDSWALYRLQDVLRLMPPELVVVYRDGRVVRAWIEPAVL